MSCGRSLRVTLAVLLWSGGAGTCVGQCGTECCCVLPHLAERTGCGQRALSRPFQRRNADRTPGSLRVPRASQGDGLFDAQLSAADAFWLWVQY